MSFPQTLAGLAVALAFAVNAQADGPLSPEQAQQSFQTADELAVELVAAEPLIASPCAMAFDERGRLFVAENRGYPQGPGDGQPGVGVIALLEDLDGDGRMDKRTVFADQLTFPNGVMPWKGGLLVTCAPDLLYFRDTDGDGRADERRVLLTGFDTTASTQLRVNQPLLGLDGWIWLASGLSGGKISNPEHLEFGSIQLKTDLRFAPESGRFEAVDGRSQYGHSFDEFGRRFICMNRIQVQHVVLSAKDLRKNPQLAFSDTVQNCPELVPNPLLRGGSGAARIFPISKNITTADSHAGTFSAACAVTIWPGGALPESYGGNALSCDPTGNLVHADRLESRGATFAAHPKFDGKELLASRDDWFRPVFLGTGPDGALYVCDMYRKVIEHPDYLPVEVRKHTDFAAGNEMGRIWRVSKKGGRLQRAAFPENLTTTDLIPRLASGNGWERQTALRLLTERKESVGKAELVRGFTVSSVSAQAALLLALQKQLATSDTGTLARALGHADPNIRELALRLWPAGSNPVEKAHDPDSRVRFQSALALGDSNAEGRARALAEIGQQDGDERWARAAILSSSSGIEETVLKYVTRDHPSLSLTLVHDLAQIVGKRTPAEQRTTILAQLLIDIGEQNHEASIALAAGFADSPGALPDVTTVPSLRKVLDEAHKHADTSENLQIRLFAIDLLGFSDFETAGPPLIAALKATTPQVSLAAVKALARFQDARSAQALLDRERWNRLSPSVCEAILNAITSSPRLVSFLLDALEKQSLPVGAVDSLRRQNLLKHANANIRERASKLFARPAADDRMQAFETAKAALSLEPHPANGREIFRNLCATCHRIEREGAAVGPDLFDIRNQPKETILLHIVVPEHEIAPGFAAYVAELKDGRTLMGVLSSETSESITLRQPGGQEETLSRNTVTTLTASPYSLMPQGLEKAITPQQMADLIAYLRGEQ